jgi:hypothetical protein
MRWHSKGTILDVAALSRKMGHCESGCTGHHWKEYGIPDQLHNFCGSFFTLHSTVQKNGTRPLLSGHCVFLKAQ